MKGLGKFKEADEALKRLEDVAQWCPDKRRILRDAEAERGRLRIAAQKNKVGTKDMLGKSLIAGIFSQDREKELEDARKVAEEPPPLETPEQVALEEPADPEPMLQRTISLTKALAGDLIDELTEAYSQRWFQDKVRKCARDSGFERSVFLMRLIDVAFEVQKPILVKWGFDGTPHGAWEMTAALREHVSGSMPEWLKKKRDKCLEFLYGGKESGMLDLLIHKAQDHHGA